MPEALPLRIGDRVVYSAEWLNATQPALRLSQGASGWLVGEAAFARGTIVGDNNAPLLTVQWDGEPEPRLVLDANLCRADHIHLDATAADAARTRRALESLQIEDDIIRAKRHPTKAEYIDLLKDEPGDARQGKTG